MNRRSLLTGQRLPAILIAAILVLVLGSCATSSLHSPEPLEKGEVSFGAHAGLFLGMLTGTVESDGIPFMLNGTFRAGVDERLELGVNAGMLGGDVCLKHGFSDHEDPAQLSLIGGLGLMVWQLPDANIGLLAGYNFDDVFQPYIGARQHLLLGNGLMPYLNLIAGAELFAGEHVSFMFEFDYSWNWFILIAGEDTDFGDAMNMSLNMAIINAGLSLKF